MRVLQIKKEKKTILNKQNRIGATKSEEYYNLELVIKQKVGKNIRCYVPIKEVTFNRGQIRRKVYILIEELNAPNVWQIIDKNLKVVVPRRLVNREITLKKGNERIEGIVLKATPLEKGPEGESFPFPPLK